MTNAVEQTKREMYDALANLKGRIGINYSIKDMLRGADEFEHALEAHLEELRKDRAAIAEERDTMRNQLQALQMASSTAAEVIRGLRRELEEAREGVTAADIREEAGNAYSEPVDAYTHGFIGAGKCSNPFPINTVERLHWNDGANEAKEAEAKVRRDAVVEFLTPAYRVCRSSLSGDHQFYEGGCINCGSSK